MKAGESKQAESEYDERKNRLDKVKNALYYTFNTRTRSSGRLVAVWTFFMRTRVRGKGRLKATTLGAGIAPVHSILHKNAYNVKKVLPAFQ